MIMIATPTTTNASERETELARAIDDAQASLETYRDEYAAAAEVWRTAVRERQRLWRRAYTLQQAERRSAAEAHERAAYQALHQAAQDTDAAERLRNDAIERHERYSYPPDERSTPRPTLPNYTTRTETLANATP